MAYQPKMLPLWGSCPEGAEGVAPPFDLGSVLLGPASRSGQPQRPLSHFVTAPPGGEHFGRAPV